MDFLITIDKSSWVIRDLFNTVKDPSDINGFHKIRSSFSAVLLPLTLIASLYGMNIRLPLQNDPNSFWYLTFLEAGIILFLILYFKRRKWL